MFCCNNHKTCTNISILYIVHCSVGSANVLGWLLLLLVVVLLLPTVPADLIPAKSANAALPRCFHPPTEQPSSNWELEMCARVSVQKLAESCSRAGDQSGNYIGARSWGTAGPAVFASAGPPTQAGSHNIFSRNQFCRDLHTFWVYHFQPSTVMIC